MNQTYNLKKIHLVNLFAVIGIVLFFVVKAVIIRGLAGLPGILMQTGPVALVSMIIFFLPIKDMTKGMLLALVPTAGILGLMFLDGYGLDRHYLLFVTIAMIALYFRPKLLMIHWIIMDVAMISIYIVRPMSIINFESDLNLFISTLIALNVGYLFLYFLNTWGQNMIQMVELEKARLEQVKLTLKDTMVEVRNSSDILISEMNSMNINTTTTKESTNQVTTAMIEIATGVNEQTESIAGINEKVIIVSSEVKSAETISEKLTKTNAHLMDQVSVCDSEVQVMDSQMQIIMTSVKMAIATVNDLRDSMKGIKAFLAVITGISTQTNLLALNASIESARAGEAGKGFAVVADEIRKLAEQSAKSVGDIHEIVNRISEKSEEAVVKVEDGIGAVNKGSELIDSISEKYTAISNAFEDNNKELAEEINTIQTFNQSFKEIHEEIGNIASISEEHAAATEEVLATVETQDQTIRNLSMSLEKLSNVSTQLVELIKEVDQTLN